MDKSSQKILVTGVAGFLGSHLADKLVAMGHKIIGVDNMLGGYEDNIPKKIDFHNFDCCNLKKMTEVEMLGTKGEVKHTSERNIFKPLFI